ncbi:O-acyltransferase WSD1-like protein [Tanacetum coccineum]
MEGEVDHHEQPLSPLARFFHESGSNVYSIAIFGMKTVIDVDVLKVDLLVHMVQKNKRFTSLQVENKNGSMKWVPSHPNIDNHVVVVPELDPNMESSDKFIEDYISNLSISQIDYSKPLWDVHILNIKTSYAQSICVFRFLACSSKVSDPETLPTLPGIRYTPLKRSPLLKERPRRFAFTSVSLGDIKIVKNAMNVTVKDVIVGVVQSGLYRYLNRRYAFVLLPFNIRPRKDPLDYVRDVKTVMERKKASFEPLSVASFIELFVRLFGIKLAAKVFLKVESRTTLWFSNIPGPQEEIVFCGHEVAYLAPSSYGQPGALMITAVSYVDKVTFAVSVDEEIVPDPQKLCDDLQESFYLIKTSVSAVEECV